MSGWESPLPRPPWRRRRLRAAHGVVVGVLVVVALAVAVKACQAYTATRAVTTTVTDKERVCSGGSSGGTSCKYLVYTDAGTFRLTDSLLIGRFNTSDVYGRIVRCHRYELTVYGFRSGVLSAYPNIKGLRDLGPDPACTAAR